MARLALTIAWREVRRARWHRHVRPHFDDGVCACSCPGCVLRGVKSAGPICICTGCDAGRCGQHVGVPRISQWHEPDAPRVERRPLPKRPAPPGR